MPGHESNLNFWTDCWLNCGPIRSCIQGPLPQGSANLTLKDLRAPFGWNWSAIPFELPTEIKANIQAVTLPVAARSSDKLAWKYSTKGNFDTKSAYLLALDMMEAESFSGSWIWKLQTLPRIQMFIWWCMHNSIGVKECLAKRGIPLDTSCPLCHDHVESISHALRDCRLVKPLRHQLGYHNSSSFFFSQDLKTWLSSNANSRSTRKFNGVPWHFIFPFAIWLIWKHRNQVVFNNKEINPNLIKVITMQATEYVLCVTQPRCSNRMEIRQVRWEKPNPSWVKLNTDGSSDASSSIAGGEGLIRNDRGN